MPASVGRIFFEWRQGVMLTGLASRRALAELPSGIYVTTMNSLASSLSRQLVRRSLRRSLESQTRPSLVELLRTNIFITPQTYRCAPLCPNAF